MVLALTELWSHAKIISVALVNPAVMEHAVEVVAIVAMAQPTVVLNVFRIAGRRPSVGSSRRHRVQSVPSIHAAANMDS